MPYPPSNDVFLSYSHRDNEAFGVERRRWVSEFKKDLAVRLGGYLGREATVWMDPRQPGEIDFAKDITTQLKSTALLVAVLSPSYIQSDWCCRELKGFVDVAGTTGGLWIQNGCRVLKVFKMPVARDRVSKVDPQLDRPLGFKFFEFDAERNMARELFLHENPEVRKLYDPRVDDVAQAAFRVISDMGFAERAGPTPAKATVYLAETTEDLNDQSLKMRRELEARGYKIVPEFQLPVRSTEAKTAICDGLQRARCSIHLFGARTGWIPEGESRSVVILQHELAAQREGNGFARVLWIPPGLVPAEPLQGEFLESLRRSPESRSNFELAEVPFEELKAIVLDKLAVNGERARPPVKERARRVYLIGDALDDDAARTLADRLMDASSQVELPLRSSDQASAMRDHVETLKRADTVAIYWGSADLAWLRRQQRELRDICDAAPPGPLGCIVIGPPDTPDKRAFRTKDITVIRIPDSGGLETILQFVEAAPLRGGPSR